MQPVHDLNLLRVLAALYRTRHVSRAAVELGQTQSALSHALGRLREQYGDPLFVRAARGVTPTPLALSLQAEVEEVLRRAEDLGRRAPFDPATAEGRLVLATTDYFEILVLPALLGRLQAAAPGLTLSVRPTGGELPRAALEQGQADLAIAGFYDDLPEGYHTTPLLVDGFATATRAGRCDGPPTLAAWRADRHALITLQGDFADRLGLDRAFVVGTYSFTSLAWTLAETDLWLTAPRGLLTRYARYFPITVYPCPVETPPLTLRMVWHARTQHDPLRRWLREQIRAVLPPELRPTAGKGSP